MHVCRFKLANDKYRKFASKDLVQDSAEEEIEELLAQKERDRSSMNTSLANLLAEIQSANKTKDDLARDKKAKLRELECTSLHLPRSQRVHQIRSFPQPSTRKSKLR